MHRESNLLALCYAGAAAGLFLGIFLCLFDPLAVKVLGAGIFVASAVFAATAIRFSQRG